AVEAFDVMPPNDEVVALACRDVGADISRNFRDDVRFRVASFDNAVDQTVGPEIFDPGDAERKRDVVAYGLDLHRQERFWPKAEIDLAILDEVHRRRADEGGDESVGGVAVNFLRGGELRGPAVGEVGE